MRGALSGVGRKKMSKKGGGGRGKKQTSKKKLRPERIIFDIIHPDNCWHVFL